MFNIERKAPSRECVQRAKEKAEYNLRHLRSRMLMYAGIPALLLLPYCAYTLIGAYAHNQSSVSISVEALIVLFLTFFSAVCSFETYRARLGYGSEDDEFEARAFAFFGCVGVNGVVVSIIYQLFAISGICLGVAVVLPTITSLIVVLLPPTIRAQIEGYNKATTEQISLVKGKHPKVDAYIESVGDEGSLTKAEVSYLYHFLTQEDEMRKRIEARERLLLENTEPQAGCTQTGEKEC